VRDDDAASDVLQDTLIIICRRLGSVRDVEWMRAWAYRVATREAVRAARKAHRQAGDPLDDVDHVPAPAAEPQAVDEELLAALPDKLAEVPAGAQIVLRLHYLQSLSQQEVAEALEIPLGTVKSRLAYGLQCLRKAWAP
jgi:RNA polymerase sigma-70 factor (ECF subfamily)